MDLHFATEKVASLKDAGLRYLVIVAGILTALALGQWTEARRHAQQGAQALADIEGELRRNEALLAGALDTQAAQLAQLERAEEQLGKTSFAVPDLEQRARRLLAEVTLDGVGDFNLVALQRSNWDAAVASQSLQYLPRDRTVALARAYAAAQEISAISRQVTINGATFNNLIALDMYDRGEMRDALRFARALREHRLTLTSIHGGYRALRGVMREAAGMPAAAPTAAASAASGGR